MKRFSMVAVLLAFSALFSVSAFAQGGAAPAATGTTKIGFLNTSMFEDEKDGIRRYVNANKQLETEFKTRYTELVNLDTRIKAIEEELRRAQNQPANSPVPLPSRETLMARAAEGKRLQDELEFKKKGYEDDVTRRRAELVSPVSQDIGKAIEEFRKTKGYTIVLDLSALAEQGAILALDLGADVTKEFVAFFNAKPTPAASATTRP